MKIDIKCVDIKKKNEIILENFSLKFSGKKLLIQGHNGIGKTTLVEYMLDKIFDYNNVFYVTQIPEFFSEFSINKNIELISKGKSSYGHLVKLFKLDEIIESPEIKLKN